MSVLTLGSSMGLYGSVMALIWVAYGITSRRNEKRNVAIKSAAVAAGLTEPATLHPLINTATCIGCGACTRACPEGDVLGVIAGKAELIEPSHCIGHGECAKSCPTKSISLVFGTARRGIELPQLAADFQTSVPGLYIAGELGGMGLIRNAVEQGRQAVEAIAKRGHRAPAGELDLVIVGAGPAGIAAALAAKAHKLRYQVIEQDDLGGAVFKYPRAKVVTTHPVKLPLVGAVKLGETSKEVLLQLWRKIEATHKLAIRYRERVESIDHNSDGFVVRTSKAAECCQSVLLAIGRRGTPRRLNVPGEDIAKVVYQLIDPAQYAGQRVLVVGGGDTAVEAALTLCGVPGTVVTMSYRGENFHRIRPATRQQLEYAVSEGRLTVMTGSELRLIGETSVTAEWNGRSLDIANDAVIICAGGVLPGDFLRQAGVVLETKYGTA